MGINSSQTSRVGLRQHSNSTTQGNQADTKKSFNSAIESIRRQDHIANNINKLKNVMRGNSGR